MLAYTGINPVSLRPADPRAQAGFQRVSTALAVLERGSLLQAWKKLMPIPTPRDHLTVSVTNGLLYAIGGRVNVNYNQNLNAHEAYDPKSNQCKSLAPLPTARSGITSQYIKGKIYVFGGESGEGTFSENEAYDPKTNQWHTQPPMPKSCHGLGSALVNGNIHLLNGGPHPGGGGSTYHQVFTPQ